MRIFIKYHQNVIEAITWDRLHVQIIIALLEDYFQINNQRNGVDQISLIKVGQSNNIEGLSHSTITAN